MNRISFKFQVFLDRVPRIRRRARLFERRLRSIGLFRVPRVQYAFLLSYPRSGSHWIRYLVETVGSSSTSGGSDGYSIRDTALNGGDTPIHYRLNIDVENRKPVLIKRHEMKDHDDNSRPLIFLIRNPIDAISSHLEFAGDLWDIERETQTFSRICQQVDVHLGTISYVYFEDITSQKPEELIGALSEAFSLLPVSIDPPKLSDVIEHLESHAARARSILGRSPVSDSSLSRSSEACQHRAMVRAALENLAPSSPTLEEILDRYPAART